MYTKTCLRAHNSRSKYTLTCKQGDPTLVLLQAERHWAQVVLFVQHPEQEQPGVERTAGCGANRDVVHETLAHGAYIRH